MVTRAAADLADPSYGKVADTLRAAAREFARRAVDLAGAKTDVGGAYHLHDLAEGEYRVIGGHEAHRPRTDGWALVRSGEPFRLDIELAAGRAIAGRVVDDAGRPVPGAAVSARRSSDRRVAPQWKIDRIIADWAEGGILLERGQTASNDEGTFRLGSLEPLPQDLRIAKEGYAPLRLFDVAPGGEPVEVVLSRGLSIRGRVLDSRTQPLEGSEVLLVILGPERPRPAAVGQARDEVLLYPADRIEGTVRNAAGNPVAGARISYEVPSWQRVFVHRVMGGLEGSVRSAADGFFAVEVPSLLQGIRFPHDRSTLEVVAIHPSLGIGRSGLFDAPLKGEPWPRVEIVLRGTSSLEGKVSDERGQPVTGAVVLAGRKTSAEDNHAIDHGPVLIGSSNASGAYAIAGLEPGNYQVEAWAQSRPRTILDPVEVGAEPRVLDIALEPGTTLEGLVVDDAGLAVAEAEVFARDGNRVIASVRTDGNGRWRLGGLPVRELTLVARAPDHEDPNESEAQVVRPGEAPKVLVLTRLSSLSGSAVDSLTGNPVSSFEVFVSLASLGSAEANTSDTRGELVPREFIDPRGMFRIDGLRPGSFFLAVRARGFAVWAQRVTLAPGEDTDVRVLLERGWTLRGTVVDRETGLPIPNARVVCSRHGRRQEDLPCHVTLSDTRDWTDAMGQFAVSGLDPGEYSVSTHHPGYIPDKDQGQGRVAIGDTEPEFLRLGMLAAGGLQGKIENLGENWIAVRLVLRRVDGESGGDLRCNPEPNGRFHAASILPGTYQVELEKYQSKPKPQIVRMGEPLGEVVIRAGETATFDARAP